MRWKTNYIKESFDSHDLTSLKKKLLNFKNRLLEPSSAIDLLRTRTTLANLTLTFCSWPDYDIDS